ncbi:tetratricopeptide repeat protein [Corynebacterium urogenitale]|nr:tetratricopeptide repeat protein [Corynebacterium urogenitale]
MSEHSGGRGGRGHGAGNRRPNGNSRGNGVNRGFKSHRNGDGQRGFSGGGRGRSSRDADASRENGRRRFSGGDDKRGGYRRGDDKRDARRDDRRGGQNSRGEGRRSNDRRQGSGKFRKSNRGGVNRAHHSGPQRSGYREERLNKRLNEPAIPADVDPRELDPSVRQELRSLSKDNADMVAKHLIMVATLLDEDPEKALVHARAAKDRAGRVSVARETNGIAAYHAGEWKEAISELRASRRMSGGPGLLAVLADAERGLGRPEKALDVAREDGAEDLDPESKIELAIVVAGAHHDLGDNDEALFAIEEVLSIEDVPDVSRLRVSYAYADALVLAGRKAEAIEWFERAAELDHGDLMDIPDRLAELQSESE